MSVNKAEDLSKYSNNMGANVVTIGNYTYKDENGQDVDSGLSFDRIYTNLTATAEGIHNHKSLDFSNVGMPTQNSKGNQVKQLRQFHQTRLYIMDYDGVMAHNVEQQKRNTTYLISANLPEQFSYTVGSNWTQPFQQFSSATMNGLIQLGGKEAINRITGDQEAGNEIQSLTNRVMTIQTWNGSMPLDLKLRIPVIDDGHPSESSVGVGIRTNLVEALEFLGSLCLPKSSGHLGFYEPPPSPYDFSYTSYKKGSDGKYTDEVDNSKFNFHGQANNHARIMLQLGGMLLVDNVIVKSISVDYPNTKTMIRHWYAPGGTQVGTNGQSYLTPLLATVTINITTSEALTAQTYSKMLWLKQQTDQGSFKVSNSDIEKVQKYGGEAVGGLMNIAKKGLNMVSGGKLFPEENKEFNA